MEAVVVLTLIILKSQALFWRGYMAVLQKMGPILEVCVISNKDHGNSEYMGIYFGAPYLQKHPFGCSTNWVS